MIDIKHSPIKIKNIEQRMVIKKNPIIIRGKRYLKKIIN
jgi:hypothetical protein